MSQTHKTLVKIENCEVCDLTRTYTKPVSWEMKQNEAWLVIGKNGSGKSQFLQALAGEKQFRQTNDSSSYFSEFVSPDNPKEAGAEIVSLEKAARLIEEERDLDESEYINKIDTGRTGRRFICEVLGGPDAKHRDLPLPPIASRLETLPEVKLTGVEKILERGLKFMSTGEIRRILLTRSLLSSKKLLILSDPFAGLDALSRKILLEFFAVIASRQSPSMILSMERYTEIPDTITNVLEFEDGNISFNGSKEDYEKLLQKRLEKEEAEKEEKKEELVALFNEIKNETLPRTCTASSTNLCEGENIPLIKMNGVNVGWDGHEVLKDFSWTVNEGEHWLIRGPNGSGKTTLLELITGDNMQVFNNDVQLFGKKRGTGETIWDIKARLGICSYRLHVDYRSLGGTDLEGVIISGFRDTIGIYEAKTDVEIAAARRWLRLAGFEGRHSEMFGNLSYGEQRAILIIRAAVKHPRVLILDEPCHGLDEVFRTRILNLLETISKTGTTTFLHVTHDPTEALECEKHILELHPGENPMYKIICQDM